MKILHTSDWHLGRSLYGRKRYEEFSAFLQWLLTTLKNEEVDALLLAGDVFDTTTPSNQAQALYYRFLCKVAETGCRHVVIIAGNHDSPSFLNAPRELLEVLNVHVVGALSEVVDEEVVTLSNGEVPEAIVCAVPYLRDKEIRTAAPGESIDEKNEKLVAGLRQHYAEVCDVAESKLTNIKNAGHGDIPIIAMGHLFTAGGQTQDGDGVRELYVGSLAHVGKDVFPACIDYLALGHLHVPQVVGGAEHMRYCGSPIAMGFGEAKQQKQVVLVEFAGATPTIKTLPVPCFQQLARITGSWQKIQTEVAALKASQSKAWLEIEYTGNEIIGNLRELLELDLADSELEILRIKNRRVMDRVLQSTVSNETLDDLKPGDVFQRCLDANEVEGDDRLELQRSYDEIIQSMQDDDSNAR